MRNLLMEFSAILAKIPDFGDFWAVSLEYFFLKGETNQKFRSLTKFRIGLISKTLTINFKDDWVIYIRQQKFCNLIAKTV